MYRVCKKLFHVHNVSSCGDCCRDAARTSADNAQQQRLLIEHYSKVLAERLIRQQASVNAAAAATGRSLACITIATQTSESVLSSAVPQLGAHHVPQGNVEGGEMAAALKSRDSKAFQMLLDALHELPRQWLLALPPRLLRVLAGEVRTALFHTSQYAALHQSKRAHGLHCSQCVSCHLVLFQ